MKINTGIIIESLFGTISMKAEVKIYMYGTELYIENEHSSMTFNVFTGNYIMDIFITNINKEDQEITFVKKSENIEYKLWFMDDLDDFEKLVTHLKRLFRESS